MTGPLRCRLGERVAVISPKTHTMNEAVAIMTGAMDPAEHEAGVYAEPHLSRDGSSEEDGGHG